MWLTNELNTKCFFSIKIITKKNLVYKKPSCGSTQQPFGIKLNSFGYMEPNQHCDASQ